MTDLFLTAEQARVNASDNLLIQTEANGIQSAILTAVANHLLQTTVSNTTMTLPQQTNTPAERYYQVWQNLANATDSDVRVKQLQMATIIAYFESLGYGIAQQINTSTNNTFIWSLTW